MIQTYHMNCGCTYQGNSQLVKVRLSKANNGKDTTRMRCPKHRETDFGNIKKKSQVCHDCGAVFILNKMGRAKKTCSSCSRIRNIQKHKTECVKIKTRN